MAKEKKIYFMCGLAGSGKDSAANYIEEYYHEKGLTTARIKFATGLKDLVANLFSLDRIRLEGMNNVDRDWREQPLEEWSQKLGRSITPRQLLQEIGTDLLRTHFHQNIWVDHLDMKLKSPEYDNVDVILITDCRFPNELEWGRSIEGTFIEMIRFHPEWYDNYIQNGTTPEGIHISEYAWINPLHEIKDRIILDNENMNLEQLRELVRTTLSARGE